MKKIIITLLYCLLLNPAMYSYESKLFSGSIEFPFSINYDLCIFYKGQKLEIDANNTAPFVQFSFLDNKDINTIYLIITNSLTCTTAESNNIDCLCILDNNSYICYRLQAQREFSDNEEQLSWHISQHTLQNNQIPQNSVIFLFEPSLIAGLKIQSWKPENVFRIIPTIMINPRANIEQIKRAMIIARLASLDIDAIHRKPEITSTNAILTVMQ